VGFFSEDCRKELEVGGSKWSKISEEWPKNGLKHGGIPFTRPISRVIGTGTGVERAGAEVS
jgi:hypothetical protein